MCGTQDQVESTASDPDLDETLADDTLMEETLLESDSVDIDSELGVEGLPFDEGSVPGDDDSVPGDDAPVPTLGSQMDLDATLPFDPVGAYSPESQEMSEALFSDAPGYVALEEREDGADEASLDERASLDTPEGTLLKQDGKVYHVRNLATIQRWIVERRVMREDLISSGGLSWEPVGHHPDLEIFFQMVERLDDLELAQRLGASHDTRPPLGEDVPMGNQWDEPDGEQPPSDEELFATIDEEEFDDDDDSDEEFEDGGEPLEDEDDRPGLLAEVSGEEEEAEAEPSENSSVSVDYVGDFDEEAWRDAPSRDVRGEKPATLYVARNLARHPTLAPMEEVVATEEISVEVPAPDPVPPEPIVEAASAPSFDEDFRQHFDSDDLAWAEDKADRRAHVAIAIGTLAVLLLVGGAWWLMRPPPEVADVPVQTAVAGVEQPEVLAPEVPEVVEPEVPEVVEPEVVEPEVPDAPDVVEPEKLEPMPPAPKPPAPKPPGPKKPVKPPPKPKVNNAGALASKGWSALGQGDVGAARGFFVDALAANSRHADAHYGLGYTAATQGDHPTAIRHYCKALEHGSGNLEIERDVPPLLKQVGGSCN